MKTVGNHEPQNLSILLSNNSHCRRPTQKITHLARGVRNALGKASLIDLQQALEVFRAILAQFGHRRIVRP